MLSTARTVIVDEIHAVAGTKRGAHLALSLERLDALAPQPMQRIGLSATQKPIEEIARFLTGSRPGVACEIVDSGHVREARPRAGHAGRPLEAVMVGGGLVDRVRPACQPRLAASHHAIFANTRRMVERVTRHLAERIGEENVAAHHGSLAKEQRFDAEQRLKAGGSRRWSPPPRSSSASTSATCSSVSSDRRARSRCFCSASAVQSLGRRRAEGPVVPVEPRRAGGIGGAARRGAPRRARSAEHPCAPARRAVSRSWPRWRRANMARTSCSPLSPAHGRTGSCAQGL